MEALLQTPSPAEGTWQCEGSFLRNVIRLCSTLLNRGHPQTLGIVASPGYPYKGTWEHCSEFNTNLVVEAPLCSETGFDHGFQFLAQRPLMTGHVITSEA